MANTFFNIFPNENFIDLDMYQHGYEQCSPGHSFGPLARNHYLFHYVMSGTQALDSLRVVHIPFHRAYHDIHLI